MYHLGSVSLILVRKKVHHLQEKRRRLFQILLPVRVEMRVGAASRLRLRVLLLQPEGKAVVFQRR